MVVFRVHVLWFPPPIKLTARYSINIVESGVKHDNAKPSIVYMKNPKRISSQLFILCPGLEIVQLIQYWYFFFRRHSLSKRRIVPLPIWKANPETDPGALFTKGGVSVLIIFFLLFNRLQINS